MSNESWINDFSRPSAIIGRIKGNALIIKDIAESKCFKDNKFKHDIILATDLIIAEVRYLSGRMSELEAKDE